MKFLNTLQLIWLVVQVIFVYECISDKSYGLPLVKLYKNAKTFVHPDCPLVAIPNKPVHLPVKNCSQFIHCDNGGVGHLKDCAPAHPLLVFDPQADRCVYQSETSREECKDTNSNATTSQPETTTEFKTTPTTFQPTTTHNPVTPAPNPYPGCPLVADPRKPVHLPVENCDQFIHCDNGGVGHLKNCTPANPPLVFDPEADRCVDASETSRDECRNANPDVTTTTISSNSDVTTMPPRTPGCPLVSDPKNPVHLPVEDCSKFIHCDNGGVGHLQNCPPSNPPLVFDPEANRCVHESETSREECRNSNSDVTTTSKPATTPKPTPTPGCPLVADPKNPVHLPVENCNQFIQCDNGGIGHLQNCASSNPPLVFDPEVNRCVHQSETSREECKNENSDVTTTAAPKPSTTSKPTPTPGCPLVADPKNPIHLPVENCNQFIQCDNGGVGHLQNCAPSNPPLVFDPEVNRCVDASETSRDECRSVNPDVTTTTGSANSDVTTTPPRTPGCPLVSDPKNPVHLPVEDCGKFIHCDNGGVGHLQNCPPSNPPLVFDPEMNRCVFQSETSREECRSSDITTTTTSEPVTTQKPIPTPGCPFVADPKNPVNLPVENCNQFIQCDNGGIGHLQNCAPSNPPLVFDPEANRCVHQSETSRDECKSSNSDTTTVVASETTPEEVTTTYKPVPEPHPSCPLKADPQKTVLLPVENCNQFIICDNGGIGHLMDCAPSLIPLIFDPETQRCEYPYDTSRRDCVFSESLFKKSMFKNIF